jgi:NAD(P)-dependent dehydrogenase (short-subunit alcohol dehydrogenase family)
MARLAGKVAIITGGASGIGAASARLFASEGARVAICDVDRTAVAAVADEIAASGGAAFGMAADVADTAQVAAFVRAVVEHFGALHVLFANAGVSGRGTVVEIAEDDFARTLAVNLGGAFLCSKHALPHIAAAGGGSIVFTASELALVGSRRNAAYTVSKAALIGLARSMALDHAAQNIRVNVLCPGPIHTPMLQRSIDSHADPAGYARMIVDEVPLQRIGEADEIARVALFLASDDASFMTGSVVVADGGATAQ